MNIGDRVSYKGKYDVIYLGKTTVQRKYVRDLSKTYKENLHLAHAGAKVMLINPEGFYRVPVTVELEDIEQNE